MPTHEDDIVILVTRKDELPCEPAPGSEERTCAKCGSLVYLHKDTVEMVKRDGGDPAKMRLLCTFHCARDLMNDPKANWMPPSEQQMRSVDEHIERLRQRKN